MLGAIRRRKIRQLLEARGEVRVAELSGLLGVSQVTIRYDLQKLAAQGALLRDRGGAIAQASTAMATRLEERARQNHAAKVRIAAAAVPLIQPGQTVIFDAGSTVEELARQLPASIHLTVVTTAWNVAQQVLTNRDIRIILIGGSLSRETASTVGPIAEGELDEIIVDQVFLGAHALLPDYGVADLSIEIAKTKRGMIRAGAKTVVLSDASKWGRSAMAKVAPWSKIHTLITEQPPPVNADAELHRAGTNVVLAANTGS